MLLLGSVSHLQVAQLLLQQLAVVQVLPYAPRHITTPGMTQPVKLQTAQQRTGQTDMPQQRSRQEPHVAIRAAIRHMQTL
jgi:hypothetical protein